MGSIRLLLALAVVLAHVASPPFYLGVSSMLAVQGFYAISGFLIARIWDLKYSRGLNAIRSFYANRAARIYFMYWAILVLSALVAVIAHTMSGKWPFPIEAQRWPLLLIYQIVTNLTLAGGSVAFWLGSANGSLYWTYDYVSSPFQVWSLLFLSPAWTLELELWFYLLAPFILRLRLPWIAGLCGASFALRFAWSWTGHDINLDPWSYRFFPFEFGVFLLGVIAYRLSKFTPSNKWVSYAAYALAVTVVAVQLPLHLVEYRFVYLVVFAALLPMIFELTKDWPMDQFLADMSFPLYLVHWPILLLTQNYPAVLTIVLSFVCAALLVVYVERPIDRWRHSLTQAHGHRAGIGETSLTLPDNTEDRPVRQAPVSLQPVYRRDLMTEVTTKVEAKPAPALQTFIAKVGVILAAACIFLAFAISYVRSELENPGMFRGGPEFWKGAEMKLYKFADAKDMPEEQKARIIEALRKISAKYSPFIEALTPPARKESR